jgi:hypothetical protein
MSQSAPSRLADSNPLCCRVDQSLLLGSEPGRADQDRLAGPQRRTKICLQSRRCRKVNEQVRIGTNDLHIL